MALLDADIEREGTQQEGKRGPVQLALALGLAAVGLMIGIVFFVGPKEATKAVREVVEAAQALVMKDPPSKAAGQPDDSKIATAEHRLRGRAAGTNRSKVPAGAITASLENPTAPPVIPRYRPLRRADLPLGTARPKVRELFGEPDLSLYKLEKEHVVEHFVYVNPAQSSAISVLLVDGRVTSVDSGIPSVLARKNTIKTTPGTPVQN